MRSHSTLGTRDYDRFWTGTWPDAQRAAYLKRNILPLVSQFPRNARILEIGPGKGVLLELLTAAGYSPSAYEICETYAQRLSELGFAVQSQPTSAEFFSETETGAFDVVVAVDVLEHIEHAEGFEFLKNIQRVLVSGGLVILQLPNMSGLFGANTYYSDYTHRTGYNEHSLTAALTAAGFEEIAVAPVRLPPSWANAVREALRNGMFAAVKLTILVVGGTPLTVLTPNAIATARKGT